MSRRDALAWLRDKGPLIDKDATVQTSVASSGEVVTFTFAYAQDRLVRIAFHGLTAAERKALMLAWLNGQLPGLEPGEDQQ